MRNQRRKANGSGSPLFNWDTPRQIFERSRMCHLKDYFFATFTRIAWKHIVCERWEQTRTMRVCSRRSGPEFRSTTVDRRNAIRGVAIHCAQAAFSSVA
jgi:hypothetical protein